MKKICVVEGFRTNLLELPETDWKTGSRNLKIESHLGLTEENSRLAVSQSFEFTILYPK